MKGPDASWKGICSTYMRDQSRGPEKEDLEEAWPRKKFKKEAKKQKGPGTDPRPRKGKA